jgi:hypothetical protein
MLELFPLLALEDLGFIQAQELQTKVFEVI